MINFKRFFLSFFLGHFFSEIPKIPHQLYNRKALPYLTQKRVMYYLPHSHHIVEHFR